MRAFSADRWKGPHPGMNGAPFHASVNIHYRHNQRARAVIWSGSLARLKGFSAFVCQDDFEGVVSETNTHVPTKLTNEIIAAAIEGYEGQRKRIDQQIAELRAMLMGGPAEIAATPESPKRKRRRMSAAGRRAAEAQRKRWARIRGESEPSAPARTEVQKVPRAKRRISEEGMKRIIAATKKRWPLAKAAKARLSAAKKAAPTTKKAAAKKVAAKKMRP